MLEWHSGLIGFFFQHFKDDFPMSSGLYCDYLFNIILKCYRLTLSCLFLHLKQQSFRRREGGRSHIYIHIFIITFLFKV